MALFWHRRRCVLWHRRLVVPFGPLLHGNLVGRRVNLEAKYTRDVLFLRFWLQEKRVDL